jgi:hypothetical protein
MRGQGITTRVTATKAKGSFDGSAYGQGRTYGETASLSPNKKLAAASN